MFAPERSCFLPRAVLDGRRATTHWAEAERLAKGFLSVQVESDPIYVQDGPVWSSRSAFWMLMFGAMDINPEVKA